MFFGSLFGGLFDLDNDGITEPDEEFLAFQLFDEDEEDIEDTGDELFSLDDDF